LDILSITQNFRTWLCQSGGVEIPQFPVCIPHGWIHPDFVISAMSPGKEDFFSFQMMNPICKSPFVDATNPTSSLIWLIKPFSNKTQKKISNLLDTVVKSIYAESNKISFSVKTSGCLIDTCGERGCSWKLLINGVEFGSYSILSEILGKPLDIPVCICTISLDSFIRYCSSSVKFDEWAKGKKLMSFVASHALIEKCNAELTEECEVILNNRSKTDYENLISISKLLSKNILKIPDNEKKQLQKSFLSSVENIKKLSKIANEE